MVDTELTQESIVAFVKTEEELRDVVASEADGLIVIDGRVELSSGEPLILFEGQRLAGNRRVGRNGMSELVFHHHKSFNILKMADDSQISELKITVEFEDYKPQEALFELKGSQEIKFRNLSVALINYSGRVLEDVSIVYLDNDALLDCEGDILIDVFGNKLKGFKAANNSRLNFRGNVAFVSGGRENYVLWLYNSATVNLFSHSSLRADYADGNIAGNGGIFNSDSTVNIFGGSSLYLAGDKILVNESDTMNGFFVYKNAEISIRGLASDKADKWKCTRFWRLQEATDIGSLEVYQSEFIRVEESDVPESIQKAL